MQSLIRINVRDAKNTMHSVVRENANATRKPAVENQKGQSNDTKQSNDDEK
jgi:hypothetical protein